MTINIELTDEEIKEAVLQIVAEKLAKSLNSEFPTSIQYITRKEVKAVIRELLKEQMDDLSERAVAAAAKSIENKGIKKMLEEAVEG